MRIVPLLAVLASLSACSTVSRIRTDDLGRAPSAATQASDIKVYSTQEIGRRYEILGAVVASADGEDSEKPVLKLKEEAAQLGATMIVGLRLEIEYGYWDIAVKASGLAVR